MGTFFQNEKFRLFISEKWHFCLLLLLLFFTPISIESLNLYLPFSDESFSISLVFPFRFPILYLLPITALFVPLSFFLKKKIAKNFRFVNYSLIFFSFSFYIFCVAFCVISNANCAEWFLKIPFYIYLTFLLGLISHFYCAFIGITYLRKKNPEYVEYLKLREEDRLKKQNTSISALLQQRDFSQIKKIFIHRVRKLSVKRKFTFVIIGVIIVILLTFMLLILNRYKNMFTEAVSDVGRAQAEQTAAVYDSAEGKYSKIAAFFEEQRISNEFAETPFERIDVIITGNRENQVFLESWENSTLPDFEIFAYTTGKPKEIAESEKSISSSQALDYLKRFKSGSYKKSFVFNKASKTCKYIYPVTIAKEEGRRVLGFSIVTYKQNVLMRQFFRTKIFVFTLVLIFLYLTVIFSIFLADFIFNPLLFLRKNVRNTSHSIEKILSGTAKNASRTLKFSDTIKTTDEIKDLSLEIGEMVTLIKGIMPYVSFSTLQHAEKSLGEEQKSTSSRDLCFLFTDIRGFTSLCEGLPPKKVVDILNHYLDIETQIILENGGDIDKYVGDEMMAFFSGPRKEINACKAAMEIRTAMRQEQENSMADGTTYISIGIGIHSGQVIFGSVGSQSRKDFTSIGDTVNLAARLESANKAYGSKSIITETVFKKLRNLFMNRLYQVVLIIKKKYIQILLMI